MTKMSLTNADASIVIVGAGLAGVQAAVAARQAGYEGRLVLVGREPELPYDRPPLSKQVLLEEGAEATIQLRDDRFYDQLRIELVLGKSVLEIDRRHRRIALDDGGFLPFTKLVLATGSRLRALREFPQDARGVFYLRSLADALRLRAALRARPRVAIVGGGVIGLEVAAAAVKHGAYVEVIEAAPRVMARGTCPIVGEYLAAKHRDHGITFHCRAAVAAVKHGRAGWCITLDNGAVIETDIVVVGVGVSPELTLASNAGVTVARDGIVTDAFGKTDDPHILAAGEVAFHFNHYSGKHEKQENWTHAAAHGEHVGRSLVIPSSGYDELGGYWTDQYDAHLQTAGSPTGDLDIVRGDTASGRFIVYHLIAGVVAGASAINAARELRLAKRLIRDKARIAPERLADSQQDLSGLVTV
jgi:3-phenylpropionate/trans-cinnamate dioxygenase ferredoxin reductase component